MGFYDPDEIGLQGLWQRTSKGDLSHIALDEFDKIIMDACARMLKRDWPSGAIA